jgi:gas vesicle protein
MNILFTPDMSPEVRRQILTDNADKIEESTYQKPLTPEELDLRRAQLSDKDIELADLEDEKKEMMAGIKQRMDAVKTVKKTLRAEVRTRQTTVTGKLYHVANHDNNMMESFDEEGNLVSSRRLLPNERQSRFYIAKAQ